jgi:hypothetical protein
MPSGARRSPTSPPGRPEPRTGGGAIEARPEDRCTRDGEGIVPTVSRSDRRTRLLPTTGSVRSTASAPAGTPDSDLEGHRRVVEELVRIGSPAAATRLLGTWRARGRSPRPGRIGGVPRPGRASASAGSASVDHHVPQGRCGAGPRQPERPDQGLAPSPPIGEPGALHAAEVRRWRSTAGSVTVGCPRRATGGRSQPRSRIAPCSPSAVGSMRRRPRAGQGTARQSVRDNRPGPAFRAGAQTARRHPAR